ncbi:patatin-like phospholipase family protein [Massilia sp. PAMC28688]|uniref:patatin-like phospholipase family protein n=1 Tax=Massilia sp. PAMC28688 TaxID=2861283 RepID=UPI001C624DEE|nr:patatin-like phospholipase family protein [Massilia sp. PAMC28688]QYF94987.1 patatin-like phospholipase family protein [Massilia sp. PAMC28688]
MKLARAIALAGGCAMALGTAFARPQAEGVPTIAPAERPRVALVLSGGGARGFAHIGVLRALRDMRVPVDMVVGTSMGSVVGGAYAAGVSVPDLERMARNTDWDRVVAYRPAREDLHFRRREEDVLLPSRIEFSLHGEGVSLPPAAAGNAALERTLGRLIPSGTRDRPVSQLALPFRSVASDLLSGDLVDLVDTPLFLTMRASLAVPGVFAPVRVNGRLVVDGGLVRNLPVDLAHKMGADVVIAVNVGTTLAAEKELRSALGVAQQMVNILTEQNVQRSLKELRTQDILISPALDGVGFLEFRDAGLAIKAGETAAHAMAARLAPLALEPAAYALFENTRLAPPPLSDQPLKLARVDVVSTGRVHAKVLETQSGLVAGQQLTREEVRVAGERLYGRGDVERVETEIDDDGGQRRVKITVQEAPWATSRLRVGLELASDFDDSNSFALKLMHVKSSVNSWGGEIRTVARVGDAREFGLQFYQPLGAGSPWYLAPSLQYGSAARDLFSQGRRVSRAVFADTTGTLVLGRELWSWGDLQLGVTRQRAGKRAVIPDQTDDTERGYGTTQFVRYRLDTLDSLGFPSRGNLVEARIEGSPGNRGVGAQATTSLIGMHAFSAGNWAGHVYGEYAHARYGFSPLSLGGFLRLSGTVPDSIQGRSVAFARVVSARRIGALPLALGGTVRAGFSVEVGGGFDLEQAAPGRRVKQAVSGFLSVDTRFGPAYVGAGATKDGKGTMYLFLGPTW